MHTSTSLDNPSTVSIGPLLITGGFDSSRPRYPSLWVQPLPKVPFKSVPVLPTIPPRPLTSKSTPLVPGSCSPRKHSPHLPFSLLLYSIKYYKTLTPRVSFLCPVQVTRHLMSPHPEGWTRPFCRPSVGSYRCRCLHSPLISWSNLHSESPLKCLVLCPVHISGSSVYFPILLLDLSPHWILGFFPFEEFLSHYQFRTPF